MLRFLVLLGLLGPISAVIYDLEEKDYYRMPRLFHLDDYDQCMTDPDAVFCILDVGLYTDQPSDLLHMIQEFSAHTTKHYNHSQIHRGVCVQSSCAEYVTDLSNDAAVAKTLEACVNATLWRDFQLKGKLDEVQYCKRPGDRIPVDNLDIGVTIVYAVLILLNAVGTFYDYSFCDKDSKDGNPYFLAFSMRRNYGKLIAPSGEGPDPRLNRLKLFQGIRALTMCLVIFSHVALVMFKTFVNNPQFVEAMYDDLFKHVFINGTLVTYTFFVMSSFLLSYNFLIFAEKTPISWWQLPKGMLMRYIRLTPVYMLIMCTVMSIIRHGGDGPLWDSTVVSEANACRQYWWAHMLYINNYIYDDSQCFPQTWYLAADTQLFFLGLLVCVAARDNAARKRWLAGLFVLSLIIPGLHTYFQDLDPVVLNSPEKFRNIYANDDTFRLLFVAGHTNLSTYTIGLAGGFLVYHWQQQGKTFNQWWCRYWTWIQFPLGVCVILGSSIFFINGYEVPLLYKLLYAMTHKAVFQFVMINLVILIIFKSESVYRSILEWRGFTWMGRVSYGAFLLHTLFIRSAFGSTRILTEVSIMNVTITLPGILFLSFVSAVFLWVMVESPLSQVTRLLLEPPRRNKHENKMATNGKTQNEVNGNTSSSGKKKVN